MAGRKKGSPETGGRKKGTPNLSTAEVRKYAQEFGREAIVMLAELMEKSEDERTRIAAAKELLDRAYGRAPQAVEHAGKDGGAIKLEDVSQMTDEQLKAELERIWATARGDLAAEPDG